jgi:hypothetical protein
MMEKLKKMETIRPPIINYYRNQREMKKTDTKIQIPTKDKLCQRTQRSPQDISKRRNPVSNQ